MDIMLSYSHRDEGVVKALVQGLESAKRRVWFDSDVTGGDAWWDSILDNIRSASVVVFAVSDASLHSKPCRLELDYALELERQVVPVQVAPVDNLRASPLAALQVIQYDPGSAQSGFTVLAAIEEAAARLRPLPDPLPAPPPIPYEYLRVLGRQIETSELSVQEQDAVVDQLRRALGEETDESVRRNILSMLRLLAAQPWTTRRAEREVQALLFAHSPVAPPVETTGQQPAARAAEPADPREWFSERLEAVLAQRAAGRPAGPWRPAADAGEQWGATFVPVPRADEEDPAGPAQPASAEPSPWRLRSTATPAPTPTPAAPTPPARPRRYRTLGVLALLGLVVPGVVALSFSAKVSRRYAAGDVEGARRASVRARAWGIAGVVVGVLAAVVLAAQGA